MAPESDVPASPAVRPTAGVAMCVYNGARYLEAQLDSIAGQSELPRCMAIVDDGSTDGSWELLQQWAARAPCKVVLQRNDATLGVVRNFEKAAGLLVHHVDVVFFADQDDVWFSGKLACFIDAFAADSDLGLLHSDADLIDSEGRPLGRRLLDTLLVTEAERSYLVEGKAYRVYAKRNLVTGAACACRGDLLLQAMPFSPLWVHDEWVAFTAALVGRVRLLEQPTMAYRLHSENTVGLPIPGMHWRLRTIIDSVRKPRRLSQVLRLERLVELRRHAQRLGASEDAMECLDGAITHTRHRCELPEQFLRRAREVHSEWIRGQYKAWSSGYMSVLHDLFIAK